MPIRAMGAGLNPARLLPRVLWRVLPFSVLILLGIWLLASKEATRILSNQLEKALKNEAVEIAAGTGDRLEGIVDALTSLASNDVMINGIIDVEDRHSYLPMFFKSLRLPGTLDARVTLTDYRGRHIVSNTPGRDYDDEPWIARVMAGENVVVLTRDVLLVAVPVWQFQQPDGVMVMELLSSSFWSFLELYVKPRVVEVWDRNGTRLHIAFGKYAGANPKGIENDPANWVSAAAEIPGFPDLRLTIRHSGEITFGPAKRLDHFMLIALILSVSVIIGGIAATAYFAIKPLNRFILEINKIGAAGGAGYRIKPFGTAEFHGLSRSLNRMLENLESTTTSRDFFNGVFNSLGEILIVTDTDGRIQLVNWAATETTGRSIEELRRCDVASIVLGMPERTDDVGDDGEDAVRAELATTAGTSIPVQVSVSRLEGGPGLPSRHVYVLIDITERMRADEELAALARYDILTGLANRSLFSSRLEQAIAQARRSEKLVALMLLDLDHFKNVNDSLGHPMGDALLIQVAQRLSDATRETDTVARLGGDEFAVILTNLNTMDDAQTVAEKLLEVLELPFTLGGHEARTGVSIGIAVFPPDEPDATVMINHADFALYQAKSEAKSAFQFFDEGMNSERLERKEIEADLAIAIEHGQFELYYQPKVSAVSDEVTGVEALIRWRHPERGMIAPMDFIPIAESMGKIGELSAWVIREACAQHVTWRDSLRRPIPVAVNLSALLFRDGTLIETIRKITSDHDVDAANLELEITESAIIDRVDDVHQQLSELDRLGYKLCIDDFGTGYSSLDYLSRFPIDTLKIDRTFIADLTKNSVAATITRAIIALAQSLDLGVIAEGVETQEQLDLLRQYGCPEVQGYLFSKPVPAEEFATWLRTRQPSTARPQGRATRRALG